MTTRRRDDPMFPRVALMPETHLPARPPTYRERTPADDAAARAALANIKVLLADLGRRMTLGGPVSAPERPAPAPRTGVPDVEVDPAIRARVDAAYRALVDAKLGRR